MENRQGAELSVEGMSCKHCAAAIKERLGSLTGVAEVNVDLDQAKVTVKGNGFDRSALVREIDALGYEAKILA